MRLRTPKVESFKSSDNDKYDNVTVQAIKPADLNKKLLFSKPEGASVGVVSSKALKLKQQVYNEPGYNGINLLYGAVVARPYTKFGHNNVVLAEHTMQQGGGRYFEPLFNSKIGQVVYLQTRDKLYKYKVNKIDRHVKLNSDKLDDYLTVDNGLKHQKKRLTLYTCNDVNAYTGIGQTRLVVQCKLIK